MLGAYIFITVISSSWIGPLIMMYCPSLSLFTAFVLVSFIGCEYCYFCFLLVSICLEYLFPALHFQSVYVPCFEVGLLQTAYIGVLFMYPFNQFWLLVGEFNAFMLKVIIAKYDPLPISFIVLGSSLHTFLCFLSREDPLHLLESWFGGAEFSQILLVCKAFDFSFIFEWYSCWVQ